MHSADISRAAALAAAHAEKADLDGRLDDKVMEAIGDSGLLRHFVPRIWGGREGTFTECLTPLVRIARADPSAGWCAAVMASMGRMAAFLPPVGQETLWRSGPDALIAGTLQPSGSATRTDNGWTLTGQWPFVSGIDHAHWALLCTTAASRADGAPEMRFLLVPRSAWNTLSTWDSVGLRATGSHTLSVKSVFVPAAHSFTREQLFAGRGVPNGGPCHAVPHEAVSGLFFAAPLLGATQALSQAWTDIARRRSASPAGSARDNDQALGLSAGQINAAELLLRRAAAAADTGSVSSDQTVRARLDYATAAHLLVEAANRLFREAGARATSTGGVLPRLWRDVNAASVHPALHLMPPARAYARSVLAP